MKIGVMGAGGVGGYLGARLAHGGAAVTFIARGAHLGTMRSSGLRVRGVETLDLETVAATDRPVDVGEVDALLFCVKLHDTDEAAALIEPMVGDATVILTLQNGVDSVPHLTERFGPKVLGGAAYFPANLTAPGEITFLGKIAARPHVVIGEPGGGGSQRVERLADVFRQAALDVEISDDTDRMLFEKFLFIAGISAATALTRATVGEVRSDSDMRWLLREAIAEAERVARAAGVVLDQNVTDQTLAALDTNPANGKASMLVDLENGRRLELDGLSGAVVRLGECHDVPTPVHRTAYAALKRFRLGAKT